MGSHDFLYQDGTRKKWKRKPINAVAQQLKWYGITIRNILKNSETYDNKKRLERPPKLIAAGHLRLLKAISNEYLFSRGI